MIDCVNIKGKFRSILFLPSRNAVKLINIDYKNSCEYQNMIRWKAIYSTGPPIRKNCIHIYYDVHDMDFI